jgi:peptide chain release factor 1
MFEKLKEVEKRFEELNAFLCDPEVISNPELLKKYGKEQSEISELVEVYRKYDRIKKLFEDNRSLIDEGDEPELAGLARVENRELETELAGLEKRLEMLLIPKDPDDSRNIILEIRAGTGGEEAALFTSELFNMYSRYAAGKGFKIEPMSVSHSSSGGFKEVIASVEGKEVYKLFKYESGVHRVQRVPKTETQGRVHTSAVTVAVLLEVEEKEVQLEPSELKIDVFRASGPGGQSVNTTDSAVRITHIPTGITVSMQDEKSQHKNKTKAMKLLLSRLQNMHAEQERKKQDSARKAMVGTGDRSEKIRTYNFPQGRVTDHRINLTLYSLDKVMDGVLDELVENLQKTAQESQIAAAAAGVEGGRD